MAPGSTLHHISFRSTLFCNLYFLIYIIKIPKIFILLLSLSDLTFASGLEGIDNPFIALVARFLFVCAGTRDLRVTSYWIDTLVLKKLREILTLLCCITLSSSRKTNASSRRSKKDFYRRCRGGLRSSQDIPSTHHKLLSLPLHYLRFASHFPLPHITLAVLFTLLLFVFSFALMSSLARLLIWLE